MKKLLAIFLLLSAVLSAGVVPSTFQESTRGLGMGGAYTAVSNDFSMLMYNPGNLSKNQPLHICILKLDIETNQRTVDFASLLVSNMEKLEGDFLTWSSEDINRLVTAGIFLNVGDNFSVTGINTPFGNFGVGAFVKATANVAVSEEIFDIKAHLAAKVDVTVPISYGTELNLPGVSDVAAILGGGRFGFGATGKIIQRYTMTEDKSILQLSSISPTDMLNKLTNPQTGFSFDAALNYNLPSWASTFSFVGRDIFSSLGTDTIGSNWVFGYALQPNIIPGIPVTLAVDVNDVFS